MAYIMNTLYIEWIFERIVKTASFSVSLYSESAAWLPDPCFDRVESDGNPPTIVVCHTLPGIWGSRFWAGSFEKWDQGYHVRPCFSVHYVMILCAWENDSEATTITRDLGSRDQKVVYFVVSGQNITRKSESCWLLWLLYSPTVAYFHTSTGLHIMFNISSIILTIAQKHLRINQW